MQSLFVGNRTRQPAIAAFWVTCGIDSCIVGYLPPKYLEIADTLDGRLCQVLEIWNRSHDAKKRQYALDHDGVVECTLVDFGQEADCAINSYLSDVDESDGSIDD